MGTHLSCAKFTAALRTGPYDFRPAGAGAERAAPRGIAAGYFGSQDAIGDCGGIDGLRPFTHLAASFIRLSNQDRAMIHQSYGVLFANAYLFPVLQNEVHGP